MYSGVVRASVSSRRDRCAPPRTIPRMTVNRPAFRIDSAVRRHRLNERLRAEFIAVAEEEWRRRTGRSMTAEEVERVLRRYPGDDD